MDELFSKKLIEIDALNERRASLDNQMEPIIATINDANSELRALRQAQSDVTQQLAVLTTFATIITSARVGQSYATIVCPATLEEIDTLADSMSEHPDLAKHLVYFTTTCRRCLKNVDLELSRAKETRCRCADCFKASKA